MLEEKKDPFGILPRDLKPGVDREQYDQIDRNLTSTLEVQREEKVKLAEKNTRIFTVIAMIGSIAIANPALALAFNAALQMTKMKMKRDIAGEAYDDSGDAAELFTNLGMDGVMVGAALFGTLIKGARGVDAASDAARIGEHSATQLAEHAVTTEAREEVIEQAVKQVVPDAAAAERNTAQVVDIGDGASVAERQGTSSATDAGAIADGRSEAHELVEGGSRLDEGSRHDVARERPTRSEAAAGNDVGRVSQADHANDVADSAADVGASAKDEVAGTAKVDSIRQREASLSDPRVGEPGEIKTLAREPHASTVHGADAEPPNRSGGSESSASADGVEPRRFKNHFPEDVPVPSEHILKPEHYKTKTGQKNYVVTKEGKLIIGGGRPNTAGSGHIDLAMGDEVLAAGEVLLVNGKVKFLDNTSGHYLPIGHSARQAAEGAFERAGLKATGKYQEKVFDEVRGKWMRIDE